MFLNYRIFNIDLFISLVLLTEMLRLWILDKVASRKVASGHLLKKSSLLRKVASTVNKGHGRGARPPDLPSRGRSAPWPA